MTGPMRITINVTSHNGTIFRSFLLPAGTTYEDAKNELHAIKDLVGDTLYASIELSDTATTADERLESVRRLMEFRSSN